jgi:hypothetical protein
MTALVFVIPLSFLACGSVQAAATGKWLSGDLHNHTWLTDGKHKEQEVVRHAFDQYKLDWIANSEHGGTSRNDPWGHPFAPPVWRSISLSFYSYPIIEKLRLDYPKKLIVQGLEWNIPTHEHASVGIVTHEPVSISDFEYLFDASDADTRRAGEGLQKHNSTHADAQFALKWLQDHYSKTSYFIINHPSRNLMYSIADIRDFNNAAPDVAIGFEGFPGHQKAAARGEYGSGPFKDPNGTDISYKARTYGGADYMLSRVGGLWDALLGEGRKFWIFVNSDFHAVAGDFWPGEYAKTYIFVEENTYEALVHGLRSGNTFLVQGDLINQLDFRAKGGLGQARMGQTLRVKKGNPVTLTIAFKSPLMNNSGDAVAVDHLDLIAGEVKGKAEPGTTEYGKDTNDTTKVIKRFVTKGKKPGKDGWVSLSFTLKSAQKDMYFRLRGTNLCPGVPNETDDQGNPLMDDLMGSNNATKAYQDLWFYSNPISLKVEKRPSVFN